MVDFYLLFILATVALGCVVASKSNATVESKEDFVCPSANGQFSDPSDCTAYYNCWGGHWTRQFCQENLYFDQNAGFCNWKKGVHCKVSTVPEISSKKKPLRPRGPRVKSDMSTVSSVIAAVFSTDPTPFVEGTQSTTPGEILTHLNETVELGRAARDSVRIAGPKLGQLVVPSFPVAANGKSTMFPSPCLTSTGQFPDPTNCSRYYNCWYGDWVRAECPAALHFDKTRKFCNWQSEANCVLVQAPTVVPPVPFAINNAVPYPALVTPNAVAPSVPAANPLPGNTVSNLSTVSVPAISGVLPPLNSTPQTPIITTSTSPIIPAVAVNTAIIPAQPSIAVIPSNSGSTGGSLSTLPPAVTNPSTILNNDFTGFYAPPTKPSTTVNFPGNNISVTPLGAVNSTVSPIGFPFQSATGTSGQPIPNGSSIPVASTSPYNSLINFNDIGSTTTAPAVTTNSGVHIETTVAADGATEHLSETQSTTPLTFNTFSPFNEFNTMPTLFPWANSDSGDNNTATKHLSTSLPLAPISPVAGVNAVLGNLELENLFNNLTYPSPVADQSPSVPVPPFHPGNVFNNLAYPSSVAIQPPQNSNPSQTTTVLQHPDSNTVVYVTNNIMTQITVANRSLNGSGDAPVGYLRMEPIIQRDRSAPFKCPQPFGLFPDPTDCSAYMSCWRGSWTRQYCQSGSVFDEAKNSCTSSWDMPTGCRMIRPDSPTPKQRKSGRPERPTSAIDQNELEKEDPGHSFTPSIPHLFSPQHVGVTEVATINPPTPTVVNQQPDDRRVLQAGPKVLRPFIVKRSATNELEDNEFACPEREGLFQHETDCSSFWNCGDNVGYLQNCPKPLMFDVKAQRCEWFRGAECRDGSIIQSAIQPDEHHKIPSENHPAAKPAVPATRPESPSFFRCPMKEGVFHHPFDCVKYYSCHDWKPKITSCENGQAFSVKRHRCDEARHVKCSQGRVVPRDRVGFQCREKVGYFADPKNCNKFYQCVDYTAYHMNCPGTLVFNPEIKVCDWPAYVNCVGTPDAGSPTTTTRKHHQIPPRQNPVQPQPNQQPQKPEILVPATDFKCPKANGKFNHPRLDGSFYECLHGTAFLKTCQPDHTFIANLRLCMPNTLLGPFPATAAPTTQTRTSPAPKVPNVVVPRELELKPTGTTQASTVASTVAPGNGTTEVVFVVVDTTTQGSHVNVSESTTNVTSAPEPVTSTATAVSHTTNVATTVSANSTDPSSQTPVTTTSISTISTVAPANTTVLVTNNTTVATVPTTTRPPHVRTTNTFPAVVVLLNETSTTSTTTPSPVINSTAALSPVVNATTLASGTGNSSVVLVVIPETATSPSSTPDISATANATTASTILPSTTVAFTTSPTAIASSTITATHLPSEPPTIVAGTTAPSVTEAPVSNATTDIIISVAATNSVATENATTTPTIVVIVNNTSTAVSTTESPITTASNSSVTTSAPVISTSSPTVELSTATPENVAITTIISLITTESGGVSSTTELIGTTLVPSLNSTGARPNGTELATTLQSNPVTTTMQTVAGHTTEASLASSTVPPTTTPASFTVIVLHGETSTTSREISTTGTPNPTVTELATASPASSVTDLSTTGRSVTGVVAVVNITETSTVVPTSTTVQRNETVVAETPVPNTSATESPTTGMGTVPVVLVVAGSSTVTPTAQSSSTVPPFNDSTTANHPDATTFEVVTTAYPTTELVNATATVLMINGTETSNATTAASDPSTTPDPVTSTGYLDSTVVDVLINDTKTPDTSSSPADPSNDSTTSLPPGANATDSVITFAVGSGITTTQVPNVTVLVVGSNVTDEVVQSSSAAPTDSTELSLNGTAHSSPSTVSPLSTNATEASLNSTDEGTTQPAVTMPVLVVLEDNETTTGAPLLVSSTETTGSASTTAEAASPANATEIFVSGSATDGFFSSTWTIPPETIEESNSTSSNGTTPVTDESGVNALLPVNGTEVDGVWLNSTTNEFPESTGNGTAVLDLGQNGNATVVDSEAFLGKLYRKVREAILDSA